jgi:hypothetical protein
VLLYRCLDWKDGRRYHWTNYSFDFAIATHINFDYRVNKILFGMFFYLKQEHSNKLEPQTKSMSNPPAMTTMFAPFLCMNIMQGLEPLILNKLPMGDPINSTTIVSPIAGKNVLFIVISF